MQTDFSVNSTAQSLSETFQFCTDLYTWASDIMPFYHAMVCGVDPNKQQFTGLLQLGLWHLLVISAGHWHTLNWIFNWMSFGKFKQQIPWLSLIILISLAGLNPPLLRSTLSWQLSQFNSRLGLNLLKAEIHLFGVILCLFTYPFWENKNSFIFSLMASWWLALAIDFFMTKNYFYKTVLLQLIILPLTLSFGQNPLLSFLGNLLIGPILNFILFPLALIAPLQPHWIDPLVYNLLKLIDQLAAVLQQSELLSPLNSQIGSNPLWGCLLTLHLLFHLANFKIRNPILGK